MSTSLQVHERMDDFSAGMVLDVAPHLIPQNGAYRLTNDFLLEDGTPQRRGGPSYKSNAGHGSVGLSWGWDGYLRAGLRTIYANRNDFAVLGSDDTTPVNLGSDGLTLPKVSAEVQELLFIGGGYIYGGSRKSADYTTGTITLTNGSKTVTGAGTTWSTLVDAGMLLQRANERVYLVDSIDSTTSLTLRDAYEGTSGGGVSYTLSPIYKITASDPYETSDFYTYCDGRLVWAIGRQIHFCDLDATTGAPNPHSRTATNEHLLPDGVTVTGLATINQTVLIFTTGGIWTLSGLAYDIVSTTGTPQHRLQQISKDLILWGAPGIATWQGALVVPCTDGIYLMDGSSAPIPISRHTIESLIDTYVKSGYYVGQAVVYRNHYLLPVIDSVAQVKDQLVCRVGRPTRVRATSPFSGQETYPWTNFDGTGAKVAAFAVRVGSSARQPYLLGFESNTTSKVLDCSPYFRPDGTHKNDPDGTTHVSERITRDIGDFNEKVFRALRASYELVDAASDAPLVDFDYSDGSLILGGARWDEVTWDDFEWNDDSAVAFFSTDCHGETSDGRGRPHKCRINKRGYFMRIRVRNRGAAANFNLRSLDMAMRPSDSDGRR